MPATPSARLRLVAKPQPCHIGDHADVRLGSVHHIIALDGGRRDLVLRCGCVVTFEDATTRPI